MLLGVSLLAGSFPVNQYTKKKISTTPTQKCLDTWVERQNFTAVREVVNDLAILSNWGIGPRNLSLFARPLVTGRLMLVGHETNAQYVLLAMLEFDCGHSDK